MPWRYDLDAPALTARQVSNALYQPSSDGVSFKCKYGHDPEPVVKFKISFSTAEDGNTHVICKQQQGAAIRALLFKFQVHWRPFSSFQKPFGNNSSSTGI
jgi:hypothetical protein